MDSQNFVFFEVFFAKLVKWGKCNCASCLVEIVFCWVG